MNTIEILELGIKRDVPSKWDEMSAAEICFAMYLLWDMEHGKISPLEFHIRMLYKFLNIRRSWRTVRWERLHPNDAEQKNANLYMLCMRLLDWMFSETNEGIIPTFDAIKNPLPLVRVGIRKLIGPGEGMKDLLLEEFRNALIARDEFLKTRQPEALDRMIAFLYRRSTAKANRAGRCVVPIRSETLDLDVRIISRIAPWQKQTILIWFSASIKFIQSAQIIIAGEQIDMAEIFKANDFDDNEKTSDYTWTDVIYEMAKEQALGTMDDIDAEALYHIILILHHNVKQAKRNERYGKT